MTALLAATGLEKSYVGGDGAAVNVLHALDFELAAGEFVAIVGASGSGKSTLLQLLGALERPSAGEILLDGQPYAALDAGALAAFRNRSLGFVFQFHHLLREFTAAENVMMPLLIAGTDERDARGRALELLTQVGVAARASHLPGQLSGGEQQRVAVARALASRPRVLLADEPSGNLDVSNAARLHDLFCDLAATTGTAVVAVTHNAALARRAHRVLTLDAGRLVPAALTSEDAA